MAATTGSRGRLARILLVPRSWPLMLAMERVLGERGLVGEVTERERALAAREGTVVLYHAEPWDARAARDVRLLVARRARVFVVCREIGDPAVERAILLSGAELAVTEDKASLRVAAQAIWLALRERSRTWVLGRHTFDAVEATLSAGGRRIALTATEARILRRLCEAGESEPPRHVPASELARELLHHDAPGPSRASSVRNYVAQLRRRLEAEPKRPQVLLHDAQGYWVVFAAPAKAEWRER